MINVFTEQDKNRIKDRLIGNPRMLREIELRTANVRRKLYVQSSGLATWSHYFVCPLCGVRLIYDYDNNESFTCPNCSHTVSGEPYLGGWWEWILGLNCSAAYLLSLSYIATGEAEHLDVVRRVLLGYADNYKNYEVHGGIPYNKPGRFAAQVISDAHPLYSLSLAYSLSKEYFTDAEREHIENDLFRPAAKHQIDNLTPQLHNHEVVVCSSIGAIGLAIGDRELIKYATDGKYCLKYQMDNSYLSDGFWFEGALGYHYYSLTWILRFETMAKNTEYSLLSDPHYRSIIYRALTYPKNLHLGGGKAPMLNDSTAQLFGQEFMYEFGYSAFEGDEDMLALLGVCYKDISKRSESLSALIHGVDNLPKVIPKLPASNYVTREGSQLAILQNTDGHKLLFKATPYGGEHDHYDRLAMSYHPFGRNTCADFGTAGGYGSPLHYGYFKNTASHNTVAIDGENMPPCDTVVNEYLVNADGSAYLDAQTLPPENYKMLDSFTIKQWNDEAYSGVRMHRVIIWQGNYFVDIFKLSSDNALRKEWILHIDGERKTAFKGEIPDPVSKKGAQTYLSDATVYTGEISHTEYDCGDFNLSVRTLSSGCDTVFAKGPNNPASSLLSYYMLRSYDSSPVFVNVIEAYKSESCILTAEATVSSDSVTVNVVERNGKILHRTVKL